MIAIACWQKKGDAQLRSKRYRKTGGKRGRGDNSPQERIRLGDQDAGQRGKADAKHCQTGLR